jgi:uncharacterized protein (TIGR02594 family)
MHCTKLPFNDHEIAILCRRLSRPVASDSVGIGGVAFQFNKRGPNFMKVGKKRALLLLSCSVALTAVAGTASARPVHHHQLRHSVTHHRQAAGIAARPDVADRDMRYAFQRAATRGRHSSRRSLTRTAARAQANAAYGAFTSNSLVAEARRYLGTNPTGRKSLWCGAFMDMVLRETGHKGGGNLALGYLHYGTRVSGPEVGAIAVMSRRGGGHVGVVSGIDANGNPIIVSGNHNHTVAETVYPRSRIAAYVMP